MNIHYDLSIGHCFGIFIGLVFAIIFGAFGSGIGLCVGSLFGIFSREYINLLLFIATAHISYDIPNNDSIINLSTRLAIFFGIVIGITLGYQKAYRYIEYYRGYDTNPFAKPLNLRIIWIPWLDKVIKKYLIKLAGGFFLGAVYAISLIGIACIFGIITSFIWLSFGVLMGWDIIPRSLLSDAMVYIIRIVGGIGWILGSVGGYVFCELPECKPESNRPLVRVTIGTDECKV